jgi:hypothetical protein
MMNPFTIDEHKWARDISEQFLDDLDDITGSFNIIVALGFLDDSYAEVGSQNPRAVKQTGMLYSRLNSIYDNGRDEYNTVLRVMAIPLLRAKLAGEEVAALFPERDSQVIKAYSFLLFSEDVEVAQIAAWVPYGLEEAYNLAMDGVAFDKIGVALQNGIDANLITSLASGK